MGQALVDGPRRRVFVYEYLSGGGLIGDPALAAELMPQGLAMRDAMVEDLLDCDDCELTVAAADAARPASGGRSVQPRADESALDFVVRQSRGHDLVWAVAPECDGVLWQLAAIVAPSCWLGCEREAIAVASSKHATAVHCAAHGVSTPLTWLGDATVRRWVVKPDDGAGAADTRVHGDYGAACRDRDGRIGAWLEPWIEGEALSVSMLCDRGRAEVLAVNRQRVHVDGDGAVHFAGVDVAAVAARDARRAALDKLALRVARAMPGLHGYVGIDVVWHAERGPVLIEVNPRLTSAYVGLSHALGHNVARRLLALGATGARRG
jgi:predicted ATP-grasp superfamily ATP-dependent carboligase